MYSSCGLYSEIEVWTHNNYFMPETLHTCGTFQAFTRMYMYVQLFYTQTGTQRTGLDTRLTLTVRKAEVLMV